MALYVLCIFLLYISDFPVRSDVVLSQKGAEIAEPGKSVQLECEVSGYNINDHHLHWMRQSPDNPRIQWITSFRTGYATYIDDSFKNRVTPSTSGSTGRLKIDQLVRTDTAIYYCARDLGYYFDKWGPGVMVTVTSETEKSPSVFPLTPCKSVTSEQITIGCLATGYVPGPVKMQFSSGSITNASREMTVQYRNIFASNSFLAIPRSSLQKGSLNCTVEHEATKFKTSIEIKVKDQAEETPDEETSAALYLFCPHKREIEEVISNSQVNLVCMIKSSSKGDINVLWKENGKDPGMITEYTAKDPEKRHVKISMLTIRKEKWESGRTYSCRIQRGEEVVVEAWVRKNTCKYGN